MSSFKQLILNHTTDIPYFFGDFKQDVERCIRLHNECHVGFSGYRCNCFDLLMSDMIYHLASRFGIYYDFSKTYKPDEIIQVIFPHVEVSDVISSERDVEFGISMTPGISLEILLYLQNNTEMWKNALSLCVLRNSHILFNEFLNNLQNINNLFVRKTFIIFKKLELHYLLCGMHCDQCSYCVFLKKYKDHVFQVMIENVERVHKLPALLESNVTLKDVAKLTLKITPIITSDNYGISLNLEPLFCDIYVVRIRSPYSAFYVNLAFMKQQQYDTLITKQDLDLYCNSMYRDLYVMKILIIKCLQNLQKQKMLKKAFVNLIDKTHLMCNDVLSVVLNFVGHTLLT
jgi:hypothetical protein